MFDSRTLILAASFAGGALVAGTFQGYRYGEKISRMETAQAQAVAAAVTQARSEEKDRIAKLEEVANDARTKLEEAHDDAATARNAAVSLRKQLADYRARVRSNPAATGGGATAEDPLYLLSVVLTRADDRAGELAEFADRAHIAGRTCEAAYDSLRNKSKSDTRF